MQKFNCSLRSTILFCFIIIFSVLSPIYAQDHDIDSLLKLRTTKIADTVAIDLDQKIGILFNKEGKDTAAFFFKNALRLSEKINDKKRISNSYDIICNYYSSSALFSEAYNYLVQFENFTERTKDTLLIISSLTSRAWLYRQLNQLEKVIEVENKKAQLYHLLKDTMNEAKEYYVIGWAGYNAKFYKQAVIDLHKGRALCMQLNESVFKHKIYNWLGASYNGLKQFDSALFYAKIVMKFNVEQKNVFAVAESYRYTGDIYFNMKRFDTALAYYNNAITHYLESKSIGRSFLLRTYKVRTLDSLKRYKEAGKELDLVIANADKNDDLVQMYVNLIGRDLYKQTGEPYKSIECWRKYDSIFKSTQTDDAKQAILIAEFKKEQEKEKALKDAEQKEKDIWVQLENHKQKNIRNILLAGFLIIAVIAVFIFMSLRRNKKTNKIILRQKHELEEKNKSIIDSIKYAKRIQTALITSEKYIDKSLTRLDKNRS